MSSGEEAYKGIARSGGGLRCLLDSFGIYHITNAQHYGKAICEDYVRLRLNQTKIMNQQKTSNEKEANKWQSNNNNNK